MLFIINFRVQDRVFYHDHHSFEAALDLSATSEDADLAETERLAKGLRLLYMTLACSVRHCSLGVAPLVRRRSDKKDDTDVHQGTLGRLLQEGEPQDTVGLRTYIETLYNDDIAWQTAQIGDNRPWQVNDALTVELNVKTLQRLPGDNWRVTSYSGLQQRGHGIAQDLMPRLDVDAAGVISVVEEPTLIPHQSPYGTSPGTFLHSLSEGLDFTQSIDPSQVQEKLELGGSELQ